MALTRAKALLIVIGNGELLQLDPRFYEFIKYCKENNSLYGQDLFIRDPPEEYVETNLLNVFEGNTMKFLLLKIKSLRDFVRFQMRLHLITLTISISEGMTYNF